jgi:ArsR family transcriptional regulator
LKSCAALALIPEGRTRVVPSPARIRSTIATLASPPEELREVVGVHKALADPTRLRLLQRLAEEPATVSELTGHVDLSQPLVSWHLRRLRSAGLIRTERHGREVICTLSREAFARFRERERDLLGLAS